MKKYIVVAYGGGETYMPKLFSDKNIAYSYYAKDVLDKLDEYVYISDDEYEHYSKAFEDKNAENIKEALAELMEKYSERNDVWKTPKGYTFGENDIKDYGTKIFEVNQYPM